MKYHWLLLWTLAAYVSCVTTTEIKINVAELADGIKLSCEGKKDLKVIGNGREEEEMKLTYEDKNSGEYKCEESAIYVKFRTCDNCVELDTASIVSVAIGNLVATVVIGVAVYIVASQRHTAQPAPTKKRSDRQNLIPNEAGSSSNDHYQRLRHKQPKDEYDVLRK